MCFSCFSLPLTRLEMAQERSHYYHCYCSVERSRSKTHNRLKRMLFDWPKYMSKGSSNQKAFFNFILLCVSDHFFKMPAVNSVSFFFFFKGVGLSCFHSFYCIMLFWWPLVFPSPVSYFVWWLTIMEILICNCCPLGLTITWWGCYGLCF